MTRHSDDASLHSSTDRQLGLASLFSPRAISVVGATEETSRAGGRALAILKTVGYKGPIYPVNPSHTRIHGFKSYFSLLEIPQPVDLAIISLAPTRVPAAIRECGQSGIGAAVVFADGFGDAVDNPAAYHMPTYPFLPPFGLIPELELTVSAF